MQSSPIIIFTNIELLTMSVRSLLAKTGIDSVDMRL
jgi:hypothetical protein